MAGRARLWAPVTTPGDYLTLEFVEFHPAPAPTPATYIIDSQNRRHRIMAPGATRSMTTLSLYLLGLDLNLLNNTDAATRRRLPDWFRHYCLDADCELIVYTEEDGYGVEPDGSRGAAYMERRAYKCHLDDIPPAVFGTRNRLDGGTADVLAVTFSAHNWGTFTGFDALYTSPPAWEVS